MAPEVVDAMIPYMKEHFGNPSSTHTFGRTTKAAIVKARKLIADKLNCAPGEIIFTSGGTEADNMAIRCAVRDLGVTRIITSAIEHHAVLHTAEQVEKYNEKVKVDLVRLSENGHVDLDHLKELLKDQQPTLVSLMHGNNEIGNLLPLKEVSALCREFGALFHSDTVQTMGHYAFDLKALDIDFVTCAAHKLHGPKGVGFLYINQKIHLEPMIEGGSQERDMRGGTENLYGIVGLAKAIELAYEDVEGHQQHVQGIKSYMIDSLKEAIPEVHFNGCIESERSLYTVLNVCLPPLAGKETFLLMMDINGVAASGGSACSSGSNKGSHVLSAIGADPDRLNVRFSFSRYTTKAEIDHTIEVLKKVLQPQVVN